MSEQTLKRKRGRPSSFEHEAALETAMKVFWSRGYEGASMSELAEAMHMNKASIYAAFGSKEDLFRQALQRYVNGPAAFAREALDEPTAFGVVEKLLSGAARFLAAADQPYGCMLVQAALACSAESGHIHAELAAYRVAYEKALETRLERAKAENDLASGTDCAALAKLVVMVHQGLSIQAVNGATSDELLGAARLFLDQFKCHEEILAGRIPDRMQ